MTKCVTSGKTVLLQDVMETLDPSLDNILNKSFLKGVGTELQVKIGDDLVVQPEVHAVHHDENEQPSLHA